MEPQVRVHLGASAVSGPSGFGLMGGLDARLTRVLYMDIGGFGSVMSLPDQVDIDVTDQSDYFRLRHAIYLAPGVRIPHRQPERFAWDLTFRFGPALTWTADLNPDSFAVEPKDAYRVSASIAGNGGLELLVRRNNVGVRASGRYFLANIIDYEANDYTLVFMPQLGLEAIYQF